MQSLHQCNRCGKSFTRICYLKLHLRSHRNGADELQIPIPYALENSSDTPGDICDNLDQMDSNTCNYECYICHLTFPSINSLKYHHSKHIVYEQWVDPLNVYLSNWDPEESREIVLNQPLVLVENLDINCINLKSLTEFEQRNKNWIEELQEKNGSLSENDLQNILNVENGDYSTPQDDNGTVFEILFDIQQNDSGSSLEISDFEDSEALQSQLRLNEQPVQAQVSTNGVQSQVYTNGNADEFVLYISSDSEDDVMEDLTESFHCYFCNGRFPTLNMLGEHVKFCNFKYEPLL